MRSKILKQIFVISLLFFFVFALSGCEKKAQIDENLVALWSGHEPKTQDTYAIDLYDDGTYTYYSGIKSVSGVAKYDSYTGTWSVKDGEIEFKSSDSGKITTATYDKEYQKIEVVSASEEPDTVKKMEYLVYDEESRDLFLNILGVNE